MNEFTSKKDLSNNISESNGIVSVVGMDVNNVWMGQVTNDYRLCNKKTGLLVLQRKHVEINYGSGETKEIWIDQITVTEGD